MAATTQLSTLDGSELCVLCPEKHHRTRPSFCQCKHCSIALCLDCIKEHHEEVLQNVSQILHQHNELQQLIQTKRMMITDETAKFIEDVNRYFDTYFDQLRNTQKKIIANMELEKQNAQDYVSKIDVDLRFIGGEIQGLAKESVVQTTKMNTISTKLKEIEQQLCMYQLIRTENGIDLQPSISIKFDCPSAETKMTHTIDMKVDEACQTDPQELTSKTNTLDTPHQPPVMPISLVIQPRKDDLHPDLGDASSDNSDSTNSNRNHIDTSYSIDRMASDGENILYASYYEKGPDRIAYCLLNDYKGKVEKYRHWNPSRIVDMIWWDNTEKFICATNGGIYTVDYTDGEFRIKCVIREKYLLVLVAANNDRLFVWMNIDGDFGGIKIYSNKYRLINEIDFDIDGIGSFIKNTVSFCVSHKSIALICTRTKDYCAVFQMIICDLDMDKLNSIPLGEYDGDIEIRTDGKSHFFITTGQNQFYIVSSDGKKRIIHLQNEANRIAVIDNKRLAVSGNQDNGMEIIMYREKV